MQLYKKENQTPKINIFVVFKIYNYINNKAQITNYSYMKQKARVPDQ